MKYNSINISPSAIRVFALLGLLIMSHAGLMAQDEDDQPAKKQRARVSLSYTNINNDNPQLTATVKAKLDKSYENIEGVNVNFYRTEIDEDNYLGRVESGSDGKAILIFPEALKDTFASQNEFTFFATIEEDDRYKDTETDIEIKRAYGELSLEIEDSVKYVHFFLGHPDSTGAIVPAEDVEARIYVKRLFGLLPISEEFETTNEEGVLTIEFPDDIPGDKSGNLTIVARIEDHDEFGNITVTKDSEWGVPAKTDGESLEGKLWSAKANAPLSIVLIVNLMILGVWGVIFYIISQLVKIKQLGKTQSDIVQP